MIRSTGRRLLNHIQASFFRGKVPVYHSVSDRVGKPLFDTGIHDLRVDQFEQQLVKLKRKHDFVFVDELAAMALAGKPIGKLVSITFDDGYHNFHTNALPVLEHLNIPATMFLTTKVLQGEILWRDKVRLIMQRGLVYDFLLYLEEQRNVRHTLDEQNFYQKSKDPTAFKSSDIDRWLDDYLIHKRIKASSILQNLYLNKEDIKHHRLVNYGNHTHSHFMMSSLDEEEQFKEIERAKTHLKSLRCELSESFAIPFGNPGSYNDHTVRCAYGLGYKTILSSRADRATAFIKKPLGIFNNKELIGHRFLAGKNKLY